MRVIANYGQSAQVANWRLDEHIAITEIADRRGNEVNSPVLHGAPAVLVVETIPSFR